MKKIITLFLATTFLTFSAHAEKGPIDLILEKHEQAENSISVNLKWVSPEDRSSATVRVTETDLLDDSIKEVITVYFVKYSPQSSEYFIDESETQTYNICWEGRYSNGQCK